MAEQAPTYLACRPHLLPVTEQRQTSCPSYLAVVATVRVASCRASRRQRSASYPCRVKAVVLHLASSSGSSSAAFPSSIAASAACSFDSVDSSHLASSYAAFAVASSSFVATSFALAKGSVLVAAGLAAACRLPLGCPTSCPRRRLVLLPWVRCYCFFASTR